LLGDSILVEDRQDEIGFDDLPETRLIQVDEDSVALDLLEPPDK
jgi:hypothetical protein